MKFTTHQKEIIKKIASGEISDVVSYVKVFNLSALKKLDKEEIERRFAEEENGKTYKKLKDGVQTGYFSTPTDSMGFPTGMNYHPIIPKEEDFEDVPAKISYSSSSHTVEIADTVKYSYDYFKGINIVNSFSYIKNFLIVWQYLKSEGLVLEVNKKTSIADYELFFEYKPMSETKYGKRMAERNSNAISIENIPEVLTKASLKNLPFASLAQEPVVRDYRRYSDYYFEYNKANEMICSQFLDKQIYGTAELDVFIKKGYKTREQLNFIRALIPAYLALVLSIVLAFVPQDNSDLVKIQNQLDVIEQTIQETSITTEDLEDIEKQLDDISKKDFNDSRINELLKNILKEIEELRK